MTFTANTPALSLVKTGTLNDDDSTAGVSAGDTIDYSFVVTNTGNIALTNVIVTDPLITTITCPSGNPIPSLAVGTSETCTGSYIVTQADIDAGQRDNTATASSDEGANDTDDESIPLTQSPLIGIAKQVTSVTEISAGTYEIVYDLLVKNYGNVDLSNLQVTDNLASTFPVPTTFSNAVVTSTDFSPNGSYDGSGDISLLDGSDTLAVGAEGLITLTVEVVPYEAGPFDNTAIAHGVDPNGDSVTDTSTDGTDPDDTDSTNCPLCVNGDDDPTNNTDPTPVDFGANIFDPPFGIKVFNDDGLPELQWTMIWINDSNIVAIDVAVSDGISVGTTYLPGSVVCVPDGNITTTSLCAYEAPSVAYPRGRIVWEGNLGPDLGATDAASASNEIRITFNVTINDGINQVNNEASIDADLNGNGVVSDSGEQVVAEADATWSRSATPTPTAGLPATGFAPNRVTSVDAKQPPSYNPAAAMELEIPSLGVRIPIVGVPEKDNNWDVDWLWEEAGWLQGTAFPTWNGNSVLTSHVYLSNGLPGPFIDLKTLRWGDEIVIHAYGYRYVYEVQKVRYVLPNDTSILGHEDESWLTLVTCAGYDEPLGSYKYRIAVRAVRISAEKE